MLFFGSDFDLQTFIIFVIVAILAFAYHEFAHAIVADWLGDPTPRKHGRITLNPFKHLQLMGLVMLILVGFGWASTPVRPDLLRGNRRRSHALVAIAGPVANLMMASLFAIPIRLLTMGVLSPETFFSLPEWVYQFLNIGIWLNLVLMTFNLLPIPPLDGFTILKGVLPVEMAHQLDGLQRYGSMIFLVVIFVLPRVNPALSIFPVYISPVVEFMTNLLIGR